MPSNEYPMILDAPEIRNLLFYPRKEADWPLPEYATHIDIKTRDETNIGSRHYLSSPEFPHILFFHGNGEIAQAYDDIGPIYTKLDLNFTVIDYRGYGRSQGRPGIPTMLEDAHDALKWFHGWLDQGERKGPLWVMGRSLGSAPAIELAASFPEIVKGLIIESGFSQTIPLLKRLGIDTDRLGITEEQVFSNREKITHFTGPTLIIHAQYDQIIPISHGEELFHSSPAPVKKFHRVPGADHNSIMMMAGMGYFELIHDFVYKSTGD